MSEDKKEVSDALQVLATTLSKIDLGQDHSQYQILGKQVENIKINFDKAGDKASSFEIVHRSLTNKLKVSETAIKKFSPVDPDIKQKITELLGKVEAIHQQKLTKEPLRVSQFEREFAEGTLHQPAHNKQEKAPEPSEPKPTPGR